MHIKEMIGRIDVLYQRYLLPNEQEPVYQELCVSLVTNWPVIRDELLRGLSVAEQHSGVMNLFVKQSKELEKAKEMRETILLMKGKEKLQIFTKDFIERAVACWPKE